jgi:hypothetical protein
MHSKKLFKNELEPVSTTDVPSSYMLSHHQITQEEKGQYKLRARNENIYSDLCDFAKRHNTKISIHKDGDTLYYTVQNMGITITLINDTTIPSKNRKTH